jgi:hypothetical protein
MRRIGTTFALVVVFVITTATVSFADRPVKDARYRVRHGGKVALSYFEKQGTFEGFNSRKAERLESNLAWVDHQKPQRAQVDIAFTGERRLLLITRTLAGRRFCTVTTGSGTQTAGSGDSFRSVDTNRECIHG